jgi:hypothetical protein
MVRLKAAAWPITAAHNRRRNILGLKVIFEDSFAS